MSNIAFDLEVLKLVSGSVPPPGNATVAALGAIGPDLFQYVPISKALSTALDAAIQQTFNGLTPAQIQSHVQAHTLPTVDFGAIHNTPALAVELFEKPLMAIYSILFREMMPFWTIFQRDTSLLTALQSAAASRNPSVLEAAVGPAAQLGPDFTELKKLVPMSLSVMGALTALFAIPPAIELVGAQFKPWLWQENRLFEFLRWHRTHLFAKNLVDLANTNDKQAYAYGHLCHVAASVTGKPFINNITGGPYRTHWWRNRLVSNFVDAWTFGRYETPAVMNGNTPNPPYTLWADICTANLQDRFNVAGLVAQAGQVPDAVTAVASGDLGALPGQFPQDLADYIQQAIKASYPAFAPPGFTADAVKEAFVGLFAVVWFMTSGYGPMAPFTLGPAPSSCTSPPSWVTGGGQAPSPVQSGGPSAGAIVCGVLLAILAVINFVIEDYGGGIAALLGAIARFSSSSVDFDWDQLACNVYWLRNSMLQVQLGLADGLVRAALAYPAPGKLGSGNGNHPAVDMSGVPLTQSTWAGTVWAPAAPYPHQLDKSVASSADLNFGSFPKSPAETPQTMNFPLEPCYAEKVVDGSGLQNNGMLNGSSFPSGNLFFGDAVSNALQLIADQAKRLPSYNLDADRGYGWKTWDPPVNTFPGSGQINNPIPEL
jgi:hypothetical protein